jgi:hypothetical protein
MESTRRSFLKQSAAVSAACLVGFDGQPIAAALGTSAGDASAVQQAGWYSRPMRWAQLSFVENDPGNYDLAFWLDYFKRIHAEATILNAGGCVAFYPTQIPFHYRSKWLGDRDTFGDIASGCRKLGMNVVARTDLVMRMCIMRIRTGWRWMRTGTNVAIHRIRITGSRAHWGLTTSNS